jgi:hypothetical protein
MLALVFLPKEAIMSKQLTLFDPGIPLWVRRLWSRIDPEKRRQILLILSNMARGTMTPIQALKSKEVSDESK